MLGILLYSLFLKVQSYFPSFEYLKEKINFLKEEALVRVSSCCQILHPAAFKGFRGPKEAGSMYSWDLCRKACGHIHMHVGTHTCVHTHVQSYIENCKLYSPLSTPSHKKVKLNGTRPCRSTFPRLSYFAYPKNISPLMARGSTNQER